jgi:tRNA pseudouridine38-40 synthase
MQSTKIFKYKATLSYLGSNYSGWQYQTENPNTVQQILELELKKIVNYQDINVHATSRTDTGVHAFDQIIKISIPKHIDPEHLLKGLNTKLPKDIRLKKIEYVEEYFNLNSQVTSKEYNYYFSINDIQSLPLSNIVKYIKGPLDLELMRKACKLIVGEHDFKHFSMVQKDLNTIRDITFCSIEKTSFLPFEEDVYYLKIVSSGFLKYMVRFLMTALFDIGLKKLSLTEFKEALESGSNFTKRSKADPCGLHLMKTNTL